MKKILFYFSHKQTLGHTTRVAAIVEELLKLYPRQAQVAILNAGLPQKFFKFPAGCRLWNLPAPFHSRLNFKNRQVAAFLPQRRSAFMVKRIKEIKPDIFITEFFPFGIPECGPELLAVLKLCKRSGIKILASIGYPRINKRHLEDEKQLFLFAKFYRGFLIHTPEGFEDLPMKAWAGSPELSVKHEEIARRLRGQMTYTGYVLSRKVKNAAKSDGVLKLAPRGKGRLILVSRGAGAFCPEIIAKAILAKKILDKEDRLLLTAGPSSTPSEKRLFGRLVAAARDERIVLKDYIPDLHRYMKACDLSVSMSGYNTAAQILYFKKRSVIVPYGQSASYSMDQFARACLLRDRLGSSLIEPARLTPEGLAGEIRHQLSVPAVPRAVLGEEDFEGARVTAEKIMDLS